MTKISKLHFYLFILLLPEARRSVGIGVAFMAGWRGAGGGGAGHWEEGVELQQPGQGQVMNYYQWYLSWFCDIK